MNNTGIIRKIDDLGRIVIPKEIRNILEINSSDDLEINVVDGKIIISKFSYAKSYKCISDNLIFILDDFFDGYIYVTDLDRIISKGNLENNEIPLGLKEIILERKKYNGRLNNQNIYLCPLIKNSNLFGSVFLIKKDLITLDDIKFVNILKNLIENKQMLC